MKLEGGPGIRPVDSSEVALNITKEVELIFGVIAPIRLQALSSSTRGNSEVLALEAAALLRSVVEVCSKL